MTDDQARARLRELMGSFEYAYAMGHGCSLGWHPSSEAIRKEKEQQNQPGAEKHRRQAQSSVF